MYRFCFILIVLLNMLSCQAQEPYNELANQIDKSIPQEYYQKRDELIKKGKELSLYLPKNHSQEGKIDYTQELQKAIDKGGILIFPDYPLLVNYNGLKLRSNSKLVFRDNSKLIMKPNAETHYAVLDITKVENVDVYFANIEGDREKHLSKEGEWGMGIRVQGGRNVNIYAPTISNCWGDGIYVRGSGKIDSKDVSIHHFKILRARRNGISVISANNLLISKGLISDTYGTAPQSGIDIEPNRPTDTLKNIVIKDLTTHNSKGDGVMILLSNLTLKNEKIKYNPKVNIMIENHTDIGSESAVRISGRAVDTKGGMYDKSLKIKGQIIFKNPVWVWDKEESPVRFSPKKDRILEYGFNPVVKFENINILDRNREQSIKQDNLRVKIINEIKKL